MLKNAYNTLIRSHQILPAMLTALKIGEYYLAINQHRWSRKFFEEAYKNAKKLDNKRYIKSIKAQLNLVNQADSTNAVLIQVVHTISDLVKNISNPEETLQKLIEFAVMGTSAERGVLLLKG